MTQAKAPAKTAGKSVDEVRPYQQMAKHLQGVAQLDTEQSDGISIARDVADKVVAAETVDDVFDALESGLDSLKDTTDLHGVVVGVTNVEWRKAADAFAENSYGVYAIIDLVVLHTGEIRKISCGSPDVVGGLGKLQSLGAIREEKPCNMKFVSKATTSGYERLTIGRP